MLSGVHQTASDPTVFSYSKLDRVFAGSGPMALGTDLVQAFQNAYNGSHKNSLPIYSVKLNPAELTAGSWDVQLTNLGTWFANNVGWLVYWHEPEGTLTAGDWTSGFNYFYNKIKQLAPKTRVGTAHMGYQWRTGSTTTATPTDWLPDRADFYGIDAYSGRSFPMDSLPNHPGYARWIKVIPGDGVVVITERGFDVGTKVNNLWTDDPTKYAARVTTINNESSWLQSPEGQRIYGYCVWDTPGAENDPGLTFDSTAVTAMTNLLAANDVDGKYAKAYNDGYAACKSKARSCVDSL
jgi:hypothetical protein